MTEGNLMTGDIEGKLKLKENMKELDDIIKKKRLKVWTDKQGNKLTAKEFMNRWAKGIEGLTPLQVTKTHLKSLKVALIGILLGLYYSVMSFKNLYWLFVILLGSLGIMLSQWVAIWQKKKALERMEERFKPSELITEIKPPQVFVKENA